MPQDHPIWRIPTAELGPVLVMTPRNEPPPVSQSVPEPTTGPVVQAEPVAGPAAGRSLPNPATSQRREGMFSRGALTMDEYYTRFLHVCTPAKFTCCILTTVLLSLVFLVIFSQSSGKADTFQWTKIWFVGVTVFLMCVGLIMLVKKLRRGGSMLQPPPRTVRQPPVQRRRRKKFKTRMIFDMEWLNQNTAECTLHEFQHMKFKVPDSWKDMDFEGLPQGRGDRSTISRVSQRLSNTLQRLRSSETNRNSRRNRLEETNTAQSIDEEGAQNQATTTEQEDAEEEAIQRVMSDSENYLTNVRSGLEVLSRTTSSARSHVSSTSSASSMPNSQQLKLMAQMTMTNCPICLNDHTDDTTLRVFPCYHAFCSTCVKNMLNLWSRTRDPRCPLCRCKLHLPPELPLHDPDHELALRIAREQDAEANEDQLRRSNPTRQESILMLQNRANNSESTGAQPIFADVANNQTRTAQSPRTRLTAQLSNHDPQQVLSLHDRYVTEQERQENRRSNREEPPQDDRV